MNTGRCVLMKAAFCDGMVSCVVDPPLECIECLELSNVSPWLFAVFVQHLFENIDCFISPSTFLKGRYVEWGIEPERIHVIENLPHHPSLLKSIFYKIIRFCH